MGKKSRHALGQANNISNVFQSKMDAPLKLKVLVMFLSLATFTAMVIMNAGNATGTFKGNASKFSWFRGGFHALCHAMMQGGLDGIDVFAISSTLQIHLIL